MKRVITLGLLLAMVGVASATPITVYYNDGTSLNGVTTRQGDYPTGDLGPPYLANGGVMADVPATEIGYFIFDVNMDPNNPQQPNAGFNIQNEGQGDFTISLRWDPDPNDPNWCPDPNADEYVSFWFRVYSSKPDPANPGAWLFSGGRNFSFEIPACQGWQVYDRDINDWDENDWIGPFDPNHVYKFRLDYVVWNSDYHPCSIGWDEVEFYVPECPRSLDEDDDVDLSDLAYLLSEYLCNETPATLYDTGGFEGFNLGDLNGQDGWEAIYGAGLHQIINDPTAGGMGKVLELDAAATDDLVAVLRLLDTPVTEEVIIYEWDQYRPDLDENIWICDDYAYDGWWSLEWDSTGDIVPGNQWGNGIPLTTGVWQAIKFELNLTAGTASVSVDGGVPLMKNWTFDDIKGIELEIQGTDAGTNHGPIYFDNLVIKLAEYCPVDYFDDGETGLNDLAHLLAVYNCGVP